jgi:dienelactone hydrolase
MSKKSIFITMTKLMDLISCNLLIFLILLYSCSPKGDSGRESGYLQDYIDTITIPAVSGSLAIDGKLNDPFWKVARVLSLENQEIKTLGEGGELRIAIRGNHVCLSARLPETLRLVAHSTGFNPAWWNEDIIMWMFRGISPLTRRSANISLTINPLGAYSVGGLVASIQRLPSEKANEVMVATAINKEDWTAEVAIPLEQFGTIGMMRAERVRASRPNTPELRWYWPGVNRSWEYQFTDSKPAPEPSLLFNPSTPPVNLSNKESFSPNSALAEEVAAIPKQAWTAEQHKALGIKSMLDRSIQSRINAFIEKDRQAWEKVQTLEDWQNFRDQRMEALKKTIGPLPKREPLRSLVTRRINNGDGFILENIVYESQPRLIVTANLYIPEKPSGKIPAIVVVHSHHAPKTQSELQDMGMTWARSGTAVLVMDQLCAGERSQSQPWSREGYYGMYTLGNQLFLTGESLLKWMAWDIIRGIDLLLEQPYIDKDRIVLIGAVAGGGLAAAVTTILDPRVSAVVPFNLMLEGYWESPQSINNSISGQFFRWNICSAVAPRYFIYAHEVGWQKTIEKDTEWARCKKVFELYNAGGNMAMVDGMGPFPGPGECTNVGTLHRIRIEPLLNRWLGVPIPDIQYHNPLPESELMCLTPEAAIELSPETASSLALETAKKRLTDSRARLAVLPERERVNSLRVKLEEKLGDITPNSDPAVQELWSKKSRNFLLQAFAIETEPGITIPVFLISPNNDSAPEPAVVAIAEGGKELFLSERSNEIAELLKSGVAICIPDPRDLGELSGHTNRGPNEMDNTANELLLGRTMVGSRLKDVRTVFQWLGQQPGINPSQIALWGDSFSEPNAPDFAFDQSYLQRPGPVEQRQAEPLGPFLALLTALYEDQVAAVAGRGGLISFCSVLEDRFCYIPEDIVVPGILEVADLPDIASSIAPRPVLLQELVTGRNKKVSVTIMEKEYGVQTSHLVLREEQGDLSLTGWLSKQFKSGM